MPMTNKQKVIDRIQTALIFGGLAVWGLAGLFGWRGAVGIVALTIYAGALIRPRKS
jgi:hypothetical protein